MAGRPARIWERTGRGFYATIKGRQVRLGDSLESAEIEFHRLKAGLPMSTDGLSIADVCNLFLTHVKATGKPRTYAGHKWHLAWWKRVLEPMAASELRPKDLYDAIQMEQRKIAEHNAKLTGRLKSGKKKKPRPLWGKTYRHIKLSSIQRAFAWAAGAGELEKSPIAKLEKPKPKSRAEILTPKQIKECRKSCKGEFRDLFDILESTGCRPQEARLAEVRHYSKDVIRFPADESKQEKPRTIYLKPAMVKVVKRAIGKRERGFIFQAVRAQGWTPNAVTLQFMRLSERVGFPVSAYVLRHTWITRALERNVPVATIAELAGTSIEMISRVYGHLIKLERHLRIAANRV